MTRIKADSSQRCKMHPHGSSPPQALGSPHRGPTRLSCALLPRVAGWSPPGVCCSGKPWVEHQPQKSLQ